MDREVQRLIAAYQAGVIAWGELQERRQCIAEHGHLPRERLAEVTVQRVDQAQQLRLMEGVEAFCVSVRAGLDHPSFAVTQRVLQLVVDRIVVEDERVVIHHVVPAGPVRLQTGQQSTNTAAA